VRHAPRTGLMPANMIEGKEKQTQWVSSQDAVCSHQTTICIIWSWSNEENIQANKLFGIDIGPKYSKLIAFKFEYEFSLIYSNFEFSFDQEILKITIKMSYFCQLQSRYKKCLKKILIFKKECYIWRVFDNFFITPPCFGFSVTNI